MSTPLIVYKSRTNVVPLSMGQDVSGDAITSQIRGGTDLDSPLIMEWTVTFLTDGTDGEVLLTVDDVVTDQIAASGGYMDVKRVSGGEPLPVFEEPLEVVFRGAITE